AVALARRAVAAIDGMLGFVGVDMVLTDDPDDDAVIEINPRLTTAYVGLRRLTKDNLAAWLAPELGGQAGAEPTWQNDLSVRYDGGGRVQMTDRAAAASPWEPAE